MQIIPCVKINEMNIGYGDTILKYKNITDVSVTVDLNELEMLLQARLSRNQPTVLLRLPE